VSTAVQAACARCGVPCTVATPEALLCHVVCARCSEDTRVAAFVREQSEWFAEDRIRAAAARQRFDARRLRLQREEQERLARLAERSREVPAATAALPDHILAAAARRARQKAPAK
jgi:hypothetical protein